MSHQPFAAFTIVAHNYLPRARVLAESFRRIHPESEFFIVVIDHPLKVRLRQAEETQLVTVIDISFGAEGFEHMAVAYDITEFATAVKPFALQHFLQTHDCVLYIDPDIEIYAPLTPIVEATRKHGISLTPHCLQPIARDGREPTEGYIMAAGIYNLGYIGVGRAGLAFLDWWALRLRRDAIIDPSNQLFTDQRWIDLCVPIFRPYIENSPAYNVAYWNLDQRKISRRDGVYYVGDDLLRFFHFSGYQPEHPHWISKHQPLPRVRLTNDPVLADLFNEYGARLLSIEGAEESSTPYGWSDAFPGLRLTHSLRRLFHSELLLADNGLGEMPPSPFLAGGAQRFLEWVSSVAPDAVGAIPRYLAGVWSSRPDVRIRMPEAVDGDLRRLRIWSVGNGGSEDSNIAMLGWRCEGDDRFGLVRTVADTSQHGVNVVGYLTAELGVGEATRLATAALRNAKVAVATVSLSRTINRQEHPFAVDARQEFDTILMGVNADQMSQTVEDLGSSFFEGRYRIGQWFWELEQFPRRFLPAFDYVDEVWAASTFVRDSIAAQAPHRVAVAHQPLPFSVPTVDERLTRNAFGLPAGFMFLFCFDMMSDIDRKNPAGLLEAYSAAFSPTDGSILVLKTMNGRRNEEGLERLRWSSAGRKDVVIIDDTYNAVRTASLMSVADSYVSLHRSEGLGLTMAEAMLLGKPVIATGYSGNTDFMTAEVSHLVRYDQGMVSRSGGPYAKGSVWAEPDLGHAASLMQRVANDPAQSRQMAERGRQHLLDHYNPERCGRLMRERLEHHWSERR